MLTILTCSNLRWLFGLLLFFGCCCTCRQVSDAIPIPGFLDSLQPTVQAARAANVSNNSSTGTSPSSSMSTSEDVATSSSEEQLLAAAAATLPLAEQQALLLAGAAPALQQLSSVVNEVRQQV
jgi:hypothetical protein